MARPPIANFSPAAAAITTMTIDRVR